MEGKRKRWKIILALAFLLIILVIAILLIIPSPPTRPTVFPKPMTGFQYPLDSEGGYHVTWTNFNVSTIDHELSLMNKYFPNANTIRSPIDWDEMTPTTAEKMKTLLDIADDYNINVAFVLFNRLMFEDLTVSNYEDHKKRVDTVVEPLKNDDRVAYWAVGNEMLLHHSSTLKWMEEMINHIKTVDIDTPITTSLDPSYGGGSMSFEGIDFLNEIDVDFIEFHAYPTYTDDILYFLDQIAGLSRKPIVISEFSVWGGLKSYSFDIRESLLNELLEQAHKHSSIIGLLYYRFSFDDDYFTIMDVSTNKPKLEAEVLNNWFPYFITPRPFVISTYTTKTSTVDILNPSFNEYDSLGTPKNWEGYSENVASYSVKTVESSNKHISSFQTCGDCKNPDFEEGGWEPDWGGWPYSWYWWTKEPYVWPDWALEWNNETVYSGSYSINITSHLTKADISIYQRFNVTSNKVYRFAAYAKTFLSSGANVSIQIVSKDSTGAWIDFQDSTLLTGTNDWARLFVMGVTPIGTTSIQLNLKLKGKGQVLFDNTSLVEMDAISYDDDNKALALVVTNASKVFERSYGMAYERVPITTHMIYSLEVYGATVVPTTSPPDTPWVGSVVTISFLDQNDNWLLWLDAKWLNGQTDWTKLTISGVPPLDSTKMQITFKITGYEWGVFFIDHVTLKQSPVVFQKKHSFSNNRLNLAISCSTGNTSITAIYCGEWGEPNTVSIDGEIKAKDDVWTYDTLSGLLTVTWLHANEDANIVLDWNL